MTEQTENVSVETSPAGQLMATALLKNLDKNGFESPESKDLATALKGNSESTAETDKGVAPAATETPAVETPAAETATNEGEAAQKTEAVKTEEKPTETPAAEKPVSSATETAVTTETPQPSEEAAGDEVIEGSSLFSKKTTTTDRQFTDLDSITKALAEEFSFKIQSPEDYNTVISSMKTWRGQAQKFSESHNKYTQIMNDLGTLPDAIIDQMQAHLQGRDYKTVMKDYISKPDYVKDFDAHSRDVIVSHYYPEDYMSIINDKESEEAQKTKSLDRLQELSRNPYNRDKQAIEDTRAVIMKKQQDQQALVKSSIDSSADYFTNEFPGVDDEVVNQQRQSLLNGSINNLFFNEDGTFKKEAVLRLFMAQNGQAEIQAALNRGMNQGTSKANAETVSKGSDTPTPSKEGSQSTEANQITAETQQLLDASKRTIAANDDPFSKW